MNYVIDFDSLTVESKSQDDELLAEYILDNKLTMAVTLVSEEDDLSLNFTLGELTTLYINLDPLDSHVPNMKDEDHAAELCWNALNKIQDDFPTFTKKLGTKLVKSAGNQPSEATKTKSNTNSNPSKKAPSKPRTKLNMDDDLIVNNPKCKSGSILHTIVIAIEDELCGTVGEVMEYIISNHKIPKTGELADEKYAAHNIKYFVNKGVLSMEEGL